LILQLLHVVVGDMEGILCSGDCADDGDDARSPFSEQMKGFSVFMEG